ncbi:malto-oligosyltrehalose trehalohydrolase [Brachybacterium sp. DNPG3]
MSLPPRTPATGSRRTDRFEIWAPSASRVEIRLDGAVHPMHGADDGWFTLPEVPAVPGTRYAFRLDGEGPWIPDPRSLSQPDGVHAASEVVDLEGLLSRASGGARPGRGRSLRGAVLYELHVGTFAPGPDGAAGTLDSAIDRLDELVELGVDAVELMPLASFPGERGWGYDGVDLYAVHEAYGGIAALTRFLAAAHERGLGVVLDLVLNHLGPSGNYLGMLGPYATDRHATPWGEAMNLDQDGSEQVRAFLLGAARQWLVDLGFDGLRLDAVHELHDDSVPHLLAELALAVSAWELETGRALTLIAESDRNDPRTVTPVAAGGLGMDLQWADDVHHGIHAWLTGERQGYYADFGSTEALATVLSRMFLHAGTFSSFRGRVWGAPVDPGSADYDGLSFVTFLQDHDQIGNRARGDRIHHRLSPALHAVGATLVLLGPGTPMLFQGEEWAASTPFAYFTDHDDELGPLVSAGRVAEFARMGWEDEVPDPQSRSTFEMSMLRWSERAEGEHGRMLGWYRELLRLRRELPELASGDLRETDVEVLDADTVRMRRGGIEVIAHRGDGAVLRAHARGAEVLASSRRALDPAVPDGAVPDLAEPDGAMPENAEPDGGPGVLVLRR